RADWAGVLVRVDGLIPQCSFKEFIGVRILAGHRLRRDGFPTRCDGFPTRCDGFPTLSVTCVFTRFPWCGGFCRLRVGFPTLSGLTLLRGLFAPGAPVGVE